LGRVFAVRGLEGTTRGGLKPLPPPPPMIFPALIFWSQIAYVDTGTHTHTRARARALSKMTC